MTSLIVSGSGRCGTSLLMQMLDAGGVACHGEWPDFESPDFTRKLPEEADRLHMLEGAVKILDCHRYLPEDLRLKYTHGIWLNRDTKQQAKSWAKVSKELGRDVSRGHVARVRKMLKEARKLGTKRLREVIQREPLILTYEGLLAAPIVAAHAIQDYLGEKLDLERMAAQRIPRPSRCMAGMMERDMVKMGREQIEEMVRRSQA